MNSFPLDTPWDISIGELDDGLRLAGVEPVTLNRSQSARDLDLTTRVALVEALRESVHRAQVDAPPVEKWLTVSESLVLNDDGSETTQQKTDAFWLCLTQIVNGCLALVMLGDLSEFPFFVELLKHQPSGYLIEMATDVLRHTVDPSYELDTPRLIQRAEEWWHRNLSTKNTKEHEFGGSGKLEWKRYVR
jgi:hypothetical protein